MFRVLLLSSLILSIAQSASADHRHGPRLRIGRAEFGIPFVDSFVTVHGDRSTVKVFSRGDITNVHTQSGTQVDVGIRSLFLPRRGEHNPEMPSNAQTARQAEIELGKSKPIESAPAHTSPGAKRPGPQLPPRVGPKERGAIPRVPPDNASQRLGGSNRNPSLHDAKQAIAREEFRTAEKFASRVLQIEKNNHAAYSIRAAALIGQGEKNRDQRLVQRGIQDILQAMKLGHQNGEEDERDYIVWFIGMNQFASLSSDREVAASYARMVDGFTTQHVDSFSVELKEQVYYEQGFARLLLGQRAAASESFRNAGKFRERTTRR